MSNVYICLSHRKLGNLSASFIQHTKEMMGIKNVKTNVNSP